jgi:hypothetical protein
MPWTAKDAPTHNKRAKAKARQPELSASAYHFFDTAETE